MNTIKFKKLNADAIIPTRAFVYDAGLDLYAVEDVEIPPSEVSDNFVGVDIGNAKIPTGLAVEIPDGYRGKVVGRSGLAFNDKILCFEGTIDARYIGELGVLLYNLTGRPYQVRKGDRIAQLVITKCELPDAVEADELSTGERGEGGFGHSGR